MYKIEYFWKDKLTSIIEVDKDRVKVTNYTDDLILTAFGVNDNPTIEDLDEFLEDRCFPRSRINCREILKALNIDYYDPFLICYKTHGVIQGDFCWLRFDDQPDVTWEKDIKPMY